MKRLLPLFFIFISVSLFAKEKECLSPGFLGKHVQHQMTIFDFLEKEELKCISNDEFQSYVELKIFKIKPQDQYAYFNIGINCFFYDKQSGEIGEYIETDEFYFDDINFQKKCDLLDMENHQKVGTADANLVSFSYGGNGLNPSFPTSGYFNFSNNEISFERNVLIYSGYHRSSNIKR